MALSTHVTDRFGTNPGFLRNLTNHDDRDASTVNAVRLGLAADAAEGDFPEHAQAAYDDTDTSHINAGVEGVIAYLRMWSSKQGPSEGALDNFHKKLTSIRSVAAGKRITPTKADPSTDTIDYFQGLSLDPRTADDDVDS